jgi:hypothetical protein
MSQQLNIISTTTGTKYIEFGLSANQTSSFSVQLWITRTGKRAVDRLQAMSLGFCSFMGGNIYLHNSNNVPRGLMFGEQKEAKVGLVVNEKATVTKILDSIGIYTDGMWEVESVTIPADQNYPNGFYSKIPSGNFKKREGVLYSEFLRNMRTSSSEINPVEALNGEPIRGNAAYVILKHIGTGETQLWKVDVNLSSSR